MDRAGSAKAPITVRSLSGRASRRPPRRLGLDGLPAAGHSRCCLLPLLGLHRRSRTPALNDEHLDLGWTATVGAPATHHIEISNSEIRSGMGTGVLVSPNTSSVQLIGNSVHDNGDGSRQHQGLYFQGQNGLIANNVVYHQTNGFGIQVRGNYPDPRLSVRIPARNVIVASNTVVDNSLSGIMVENSATQVLVVNNISALNGSYGVVGYDGESGGVLSGNRATGNLAWNNGDGGFGNTGRPVMAFLTGNVVANPRFIDARRRNFRLRGGSPAVNRAIRAFAMPFDRDGRRRSRPDLGALER